MQPTVYSCLPVAQFFVRFYPRYWDVGIIEAEFGCGRMRVWCECNKVVNVGIAGAWQTRSWDVVLLILSLPVVMVSAWTRITQKVPSVGPNNLFQVAVSKDIASLSLFAVSRGLATNANSCGLHAGVSCTLRLKSYLYRCGDFLKWAFTFSRSLLMRASNLERKNYGEVSP